MAEQRVGQSVSVTMSRHCETLGPDDARRFVIRSALDCIRHAGCNPSELALVLRGQWSSRATGAIKAADRHRCVLELVDRNGMSAIAADEIEGICSALGLDEGKIENVDLIEAQLAEEWF